MTIAIVINTSWNIFNFRQGLMKSLKNKGHRLIAIAPEDDYSQKIMDLGYEFIACKMDSKGNDPLKDLGLIFRLRKIYRENNIDLALQFTIKPNLYGTLAKIGLNTKVINNVSGLGTTFLRKNLVSYIAKVLYKFSFRFADFVFFQNQDDKKVFLDSKLVNPNIIGLLPGSGICLEAIQKKELPIAETLIFTMTSRLLIDKGVGEFVEAAKKMKAEFGKKVSFILCGKPEPNPTLGFTEKMALNWQKEGFLTYLGHIDNVLDLLEKSHIAVLPSYREGTPRALLEACALGRPILTTNAPGCKEVVVANQNGLVCEVKDTNSLYNCMKKFASMSFEELKDMGNESRILVEAKFDEKIVIGEYLKIVKKLDGNN
jgi:glycosyltransferase involved in cell wall biosynthesis